MRIHLPKAALVALGCVALAGCGVSHHYTGTASCPNLDPVAQQYMKGSATAPVRCGPQALDYADPTIGTTGKKVAP